MSEMTWHEAHLVAIRTDPQSWPDYCPRCGVEDDRPASAHDAEFHTDETVVKMMAVASTWQTGATPELMRQWLAESAGRDASGTFRNPMPHENWCPEFDHSRPCSRQEGHAGEHSTQY